jgi:hypothetical protein
MTLQNRQIAAGCLVALALLLWAFSGGSEDAAPNPGPTPPTGLVLRGLFIGPDAGSDAQMLSALTAEIGDIIEYDGTLPEPRLKTGVAFDDLRIAAREARLRGESLGARQPKVKEAIHSYLDETVGTSGGPVTPAERAKWVAAMKDISRACADAAK